MLNKTTGQVVADISTAITKFEKEQLGRGPINVRTFIIADLILMRPIGIKFQDEMCIAKSINAFAPAEVNFVENNGCSKSNKQDDN